MLAVLSCTVCVVASQHCHLLLFTQHFVIILLFPPIVAVITMSHVDDMIHCGIVTRPQSRSLESQTAGLQSLSLASRLKTWFRTIGGLWLLMAASHGLRVQIRKLTAAN